MSDLDLPEQVLPPQQEPRTPGPEGGRPAKILDPRQVYRLASMGASNYEIADFFGVSEGHIRKNHSDTVRLGRSNLKMKLRQAQMREAMAGNVTMLIWLGKNVLRQSDSGERDQEDNQPLPWSDD